mmetsp:Transcript_28265/g.92252  ORF Transcript_28265/g.92252 Transcript_28265/m.92252 type:complete len:311 (-) Transcript_28265:381-1313(-)
MSPTSISLRLRVERIWNARICSFSLSYATASQSSTTDLMPGWRLPRIRAQMSGYLVVVSSRLREKHLTEPSSSTCTCARSPSYLNSHVNSASPKRVSTSSTPFVGLASIGLMGTPGWKWHVSGMDPIPPASATGTILSRFGHSLKAVFIISSAWLSRSASSVPTPPPSFRSSSRRSACASAWSTVCCARPMRSLPWRLRMMYPASHPLLDTSSFLMAVRLRSTDLSPSVMAISRKALITPRTVRGAGLKSVPCVEREFCATTPKSPCSLYSDSILGMLVPVASLSDFLRMLSPMPRSTPSYCGATALIDR